MLSGDQHDDMEHPDPFDDPTAYPPPNPFPSSSAPAPAAAADDATVDSTTSAASKTRQRLSLLQSSSVREFARATKSVGEVLNDAKARVSERVESVKSSGKSSRARSSATSNTGSGDGTPVDGGGGGGGGSGTAVDNLRDSLSTVQTNLGASIRNLDAKFKVSETVAKLDARTAAGAAEKTRSEGGAGAAAAGAADDASALITPESILASGGGRGCTVKVLTVSDQHATLLLTHKRVVVREKKDDDGTDVLGGIEYRAEGSGQEGMTAAAERTETVRSLLKLTMVPFHRHALDGKSNQQQPSGSAAGVNAAAEVSESSSYTALSEDDERSSSAALTFLSNYRFVLKSESGAEYSYWDAEPLRYPRSGVLASLPLPGPEQIVEPFKKVWGKFGHRKGADVDANAVSESESGGDDDASTGTAAAAAAQSKQERRSKMGGFAVELISPATERQIQRAMPSPSVALVAESPALYDAVTKPHIDSVTSGGSLDWIQNIIDGTKEKERLLYDDENYMLNIDTKWRSHPDPKTVPKSSFLNHSSTADLYCLAILKGPIGDVSSLRDLRGRHIPTLRSMLDNGLETIDRTYGVPSDQVRVFVHYQPQFYHFHVHYTRLDNEIGCQVERGHLLTDIIQNLEMDGDFYSKRTITYKCRVTDVLYGKIRKYRAEVEGVDEGL